MRPPRRLGLALGVAIGGVLLGALLGAAANPTMKNLPEPAWPADPATGQSVEGVAVHELSRSPDRYAPAFADEAIADWAPDYPDWTYADFGSEPLEPPPDDREAEPEPRPPAAPEPLPPEPPGDGSLAALY